MTLFLMYLSLLTSFHQPIDIHPIHITVINMEYTKGEFEILIRVFSDDFEAVINKEYQTNINLFDQSNNTNLYVDKYIKKHFKMYFNNKNIGGNFLPNKISHNIEKNTTEILYIIKQKKPSKIKIENTLFNAFFRDQKNLFIFTCEKTQESFKFDPKNTEFEFKL